MKTKTLFITLILSLLAITSCNTVKEIPSNLTADQMLQFGQNAYSDGDYTYAEKIYLSTIEKFGDDPLIYIETRYELGHLYLKTKDYKKAEINFKEILDIYNKVPKGTLPPAYKKLAQNGLETIKNVNTNTENK